MKGLLLGVLCCVSAGAFAGEITTKEGIVENSTVDGGVYTLDSGTHTITGQINMSGKTIAVANPGTTLNIVNGTVSDHILQAKGFVVTGGVVNLDSKSSSRAVHISGDFIQSGGVVNAQGNAGNGNALMGKAGQFNYTLSGGTLNAIAGSGMYASSISSIHTFTMTGGTLTAKAGGQLAFALQFPDRVQIRGGKADFYGGSGQQAIGMQGASGMPMEISGSANVTATGGSGRIAYGVYGTSLAVQGGSVTAKGGTGRQSYGIGMTSVNQTGGNIVATGGSTTLAIGISTDTAVFSGGTLTATGGNGDGYGFTAWKNATQRDGVITAAGGTGASLSLGFYSAGDFVQERDGYMTAVGGASGSNYGAYLAGAGTSFAGTLEMVRRGTTASVVAENGLTLKTGAIVHPVVSLHNGAPIAGLLLTDTGKTVAIEEGVTVKPRLEGAHVLQGKDDSVELVFIDTDGGTISGKFDHVFGSTTLRVSAEKRDDKYYLTIQRKEELPKLIPKDTPHRNGGEVIDKIDCYFKEGNICKVLQKVWDTLESCMTEEELHNRVREAGCTLTPEVYVEMPKVFLQMLDMVDTNFFRQLRTSAGAGIGIDPLAERAASSREALATLPTDAVASGQWRIWANPMYHQSMRNRAKSDGFDNAKDRYWGGAVGASRQIDRLVVAIQGQYLRGKYDTRYSTIDSDNYGVRLGARLGRPVPEVGDYNPWSALSIGYDHSRMDQENIDFFGKMRKSSPTANMATAKLETGMDLMPTMNLILTPVAGIEYSFIRQNGYRDHGPSEYILDSGGNEYHSLRLRAGLRVETRMAPKTFFSAWGNYRFEAMDTSASVESLFINRPAVSFVTRSEDRARSSGQFGAGVRHSFGRAQLAAEYDLTVERRYLAHRVGVRLGVEF